MNTSAVAKLLGVSSSTVQRWVKQLGIDMERNELGHYLFNEEDIQLLKQVQEQLNNGVSLQEVSVGKKTQRKGAAKQIDPAAGKLLERIQVLEQKMNSKADDVVTYQLLQHRREIEDLQTQLKEMSAKIEKLEAERASKNNSIENLIVLDEEKKKPKPKKKNVLSSLFGF